MASARVQGGALSPVTSTTSANGHIISDLFNLVKRSDANFKPLPVNEALLNDDGTPKVVFRGDANEIDVFDRKKSKYSNLYGRGFYFTDSKELASVYGDAKEYFLNIKNPLSQTEHTFTKPQIENFLTAIESNEDYDLYNYGEDATVQSIADGLYGRSDFDVLQDISATAIGDLVAATELFNEVNGTQFDGFILPTEMVVFDSTQIKSATDNIGTFDGSNPNVKFSIMERGAVNEKGNSSLLREERSDDASAIGQTRRIFRTGKEILGRKERTEYIQTLKRGKDTELKTINDYAHCEFIKETSYNEDMKMIADDLRRQGFKKVGFFLGMGKVKYTPNAFGAIVFGNDGSFDEIYVRYDDADYSPRQLAIHELGHRVYNTKLGQKVKNIIENSLSVAEKKKFLSDDRYQRYMDILNNEDLVFEELVCDILAVMAPDNVKFEVLSSAFWNNNFEVIDNYKVSEYTESIDAGTKYSINKNEIEYREFRQLENYIITKNNRNKDVSKLDCTEIGDHFYIWNNSSDSDFNVEVMLDIEGNEDLIDDLRSEVRNGNYRSTETVRRILQEHRNGRRHDNIDDVMRETSGRYGENDRFYSGQSKSDKRRNLRESGRDLQPIGKVKLSLTDDGYFDLIDLAEGKYTDAELRKYADVFTEKLVDKYGAVKPGENPIRDAKEVMLEKVKANSEK